MPGLSADAGSRGPDRVSGARVTASPQTTRAPLRGARDPAALAPGSDRQALDLPARPARSAGHREGSGTWWLGFRTIGRPSGPNPTTSVVTALALCSRLGGCEPPWVPWWLIEGNWGLLGVRSRQEHTEDHSSGPPRGGSLRLSSKPTTQGDANRPLPVGQELVLADPSQTISDQPLE